MVFSRTPSRRLTTRSTVASETPAARGVEHPALAIALLPYHRHDHVLDPGRVLAGEGRGRQHLVGGVDMHVILLGSVLEAFQALHDRIIRLHQIDLAVDDVARMRHPLAAAEKLRASGFSIFDMV